MAQKMLTDRIKLAETLHRLLGVCRRRLRELRQKFLGPGLREGQVLPDSDAEIDLWLALLDRRLAAYETAFDHHRKAVREERRLRRLRDEKAAEVYRLVRHRRQLVDAVLGGRAGAVFDLFGRTRRRARALAEQVEALHLRIRKLAEEENLPHTLADSAKEWLAEIGPADEKLRGLVRAVDHQRDEVRALRTLSEEDREEFDRVARGLVRLTESYLLLFNERGLAERIRHRTRRKKRPGPKKAKKTEKADG